MKSQIPVADDFQIYDVVYDPPSSQRSRDAMPVSRLAVSVQRTSVRKTDRQTYIRHTERQNSYCRKYQFCSSVALFINETDASVYYFGNTRCVRVAAETYCSVASNVVTSSANVFLNRQHINVHSLRPAIISTPT